MAVFAPSELVAVRGSHPRAKPSPSARPGHVRPPRPRPPAPATSARPYVALWNIFSIASAASSAASMAFSSSR
jgi:hypothetical protein